MFDYERQGAICRWNWFLLFLISLVLVVIANGTVREKRRAKPSQRQEFSFEERFEVEQRLRELGYWTGPVDATLDPASRHALIAFQKVEGRQRTGSLTKDDLQALRTAARPVPRHTNYAHIEIDLGRQVLFIVDANGSITHILPVCTGNEKFYVDHGQTHRAHTPRGKFTVLRKLAGWRRSSLGLLYYPIYLHEGIAIHGSIAMAVYPDSHGCIRIPMFASRELSGMTPVGTEVLVYENREGIELTVALVPLANVSGVRSLFTKRGMVMRNKIEPSSWQPNLSDFGKRNHMRPTRLEVLGPDRNVESDFWLEDGLLLAGIDLELHEDRGPSVEIMLQAPGATTQNHMTHSVSGVRRVELETTDGRDEALEIEDRKGAITIMRFESEVSSKI